MRSEHPPKKLLFAESSCTVTPTGLSAVTVVPTGWSPAAVPAARAEYVDPASGNVIWKGVPAG